MKNLKRLLSLALTGVMLSGMMVMGASAANFGDADEIVNTEAVDTMVALNIINGKPDGNYDPNGLVTRAEMAKMIATAVNGGVAPEFGTKPTPTYSDIKGNWAEQYIEYCYDMKYISGRGNGTFDPAGNVTGVEAAKMVLTALGYDETAYQLKGADWAINTNAIAIRTCKPSLYENLNGVNMNVAIDRDTAAQIIWNGVQNHVVEWTPNREVTGTGLNYEYTINPNVTLLNRAYDAYIWVGTFKANDKFGLSGLSKGEIEVEGRIEGAVDNTGAPVAAKPAHFPAEYDIANIGEETKVIFKDGKGGTKGQPDRNDTIYGVFNTGASNIVTGVQADVKNQKSNKAQINIGGTKYETESTVNVYVNYVLTTANTGLSATNGSDVRGEDGKGVNSALTNAIKATNGNPIKAVIDPATDKITTIYITATKLAAVTAVNSTKITMNNNVGAITIADNDVEDGLKKGDVVAVSTLYKAKATDEGAYTIVKKAETVEGEVDGWKEAETVTVDGTAYKIYNGADSFMLTGTAIPDEDNTITTFKNSGNTYIGEDVKLYMVNGYVGAAVQTSESASNYSLVTEVKQVNVGSADSVFESQELQVMAGDGTKSIIKVNKNSTPATGYKVGDIITYTVGDDGTAKINRESAVNTGAKATYDDETKTFDGNLTTTNCVVFVQTKKTGANNTAQDMDNASADNLFAGAEYKAYNIRDLKSFGAANVSEGKNAVINKDGKVVAAFVNFQNTPNGATDNTVYGIITSENGRIKDYYSYTVQSNGEEYTINIDSNSKTKAKGQLVWFEKANDDTYSDTDIHLVSDETNKAVVWTKEAEATTLTYFTSTVAQDGGFKGIGQTTLALEKDAPIIYVDTKNDKSEAEGTISSFDSVTGYANALIIADKALPDNTAKIKAIFIETSNEENIGAGSGAGSITTTKTTNAADIKKLDDGLYTLAAGTTTDLASSKPVESLLIFKFTAKKAEAHTLTIKDTATSPATVYAETSSSALTDGTAYIFYVSTKGATTAAGSTVGTGLSGELPAGTYTYEITNATGDKVLTGSFTK